MDPLTGAFPTVNVINPEYCVYPFLVETTVLNLYNSLNTGIPLTVMELWPILISGAHVSANFN